MTSLQLQRGETKSAKYVSSLPSSFLCVVAFLAIWAPVRAAIAADRPNILLILADDLGYSDIGCYGGEIETPHIDRLASEGLRFSHFRASPMCVTSRVALMAGMPFHRAGQHGYSRSVPLPMLLKQAGYRTMMTGKWHAGQPDPRSRELFDRSFGILGGATDSFVGGNDWFLDDQPFREFPDGFYATKAFAEKSIEFMKEAVSRKQPFFMYVAFNAPHHPCQAPKATFEKYQGRYAEGYAAVRAQRHRRQIELGLVDPTWELAPHEQEVRRWDELTEHRRKVEDGRMAAYAAAVDEVDQGVGRLLSYLHDAGIEQNTLVLFLSDNGGDYNNGAIDLDEHQIPWQPRSNPTSSNGWAWVKSTPLRYFKHSCHEGGLAVPLIMRWPRSASVPLAAELKNSNTDERDACPTGTILHDSAHITDLYPTFLQLADVDYPAEFENRQLASLTGSSLLPLLLQRSGSRPTRPVFEWFDFSRAWIEGDWKAVSLYDGAWQLFNLAEDRGECVDLAVRFPARVSQLADKWTRFAHESGMPHARSAGGEQKLWGWHRLQMTCPQLTAVEPANSAVSNATSISLRLSYEQPVDFRETDGKTICLFAVSDETNPVWQADPDATHPSQGKHEIVFDDIPRLAPDRHYFVRWDPGWVKIGGKPVGPLNDGAFWWRFRTPVGQAPRLPNQN